MRSQRRPGFSLVEMLVASSLVLFVMVILSEAFVTGLESFRQLKVTGDQNRRLRETATLIRSDLRADHFGDHQPLSQQALPPIQGFFRVYQGSAPTVEGYDPDGILSTRSVDHMLHFTVNLGGWLVGGLENLLSTVLPGSPLLGQNPTAYQDGVHYYSPWAEVAYFLRPQGDSTAGDSKPSLPLYSLYRRQQLIYDQQPGLLNLNLGLNRVPASQQSQYHDMSCFPDPLLPSVLYFNTPDSVSAPTNRFGMNHNFLLFDTLALVNSGVFANGSYPTLQQDSSLPAVWGGDLALTDVVSFEVKVSTGSEFMDLFDPSLQALFRNPAFQGTGNPRVFDTWTKQTTSLLDYVLWDVPGTTTSMPLKISIQAVQITIRIWDRKAGRTRQVTIIQDM